MTHCTIDGSRWPRDTRFKSESAANQRNTGIASLLQSYDRIYFDPLQATDVYTRQCALRVTARDLSVMAATLANGGVNPVTREPVIEAIHCQHVLAVMVTAGLYEHSGDWLYDTGLPGKSGGSRVIPLLLSALPQTQPRACSGPGTPPEWTTTPSTTTPGVDITP